MDPLDVLAESVCHLCLDEDGVYNNFDHPLTKILAVMLEHYGLDLNTRRAVDLKKLLDSGEADPESVAATLRAITRPRPRR